MWEEKKGKRKRKMRRGRESKTSGLYMEVLEKRQPSHWNEKLKVGERL